MKHTTTILLLLFYFSLTMLAKDDPMPSLKFGKPSDEELRMTRYEPDTTATAVMLYNIGKSNYRYDNNEFSLITQHSVKIKVLKPDGKQYADISIPYYAPRNRLESREAIYDLEAYAYNLEDGKVVKTTTENEFIVRERVDENFMQLKFSIPAVREGTVIEYRYKQISDYYLQIEDWVMQQEIPVVYNEYNILIPSIFIFNIELQGKDYIETKEKKGSYNIAHTITTGGVSAPKQNLSLRAKQFTYISRNLPALPENEPYIWCARDYKIKIAFELEGVMEGQDYKPYTATWEDIDKLLLGEKSEHFGQRLVMTNPYRKEMQNLQLGKMNFEEKVVALFRLLKQKIAWNGEYMFYSRNPEKVIAQGSGNNADLNFIFINMLRESGIRAWPAVLRQRHLGRLPVHYPSIQKLNTFIVAIHHADENRIIYLDGSMEDAYFNVLPEDLTVEMVRIICQDPSVEKWVNLTNLANNTTRITINSTLTPDQEIAGTQETLCIGYPAIDYMTRHKQDSLDFINQYQDKCNYRITGFKLKKLDTAETTIHDQIQFTRKADNANDQFLYINPMLLAHIDNNPFIQSDRIMPVDLPYKYTYNITNTFTVPEGYVVEELPKSQVFTTIDNGISCKYHIQYAEGKILLRYLFIMKQLHFNPIDYANLQTLWAATVEKNQALIVLKKP